MLAITSHQEGVVGFLSFFLTASCEFLLDDLIFFPNWFLCFLLLSHTHTFGVHHTYLAIFLRRLVKLSNVLAWANEILGKTEWKKSLKWFGFERITEILIVEREISDESIIWERGLKQERSEREIEVSPPALMREHSSFGNSIIVTQNLTVLSLC